MSQSPTRDELLELKAQLKAHQRQTRRLLGTVTGLLEGLGPDPANAQPQEGIADDRHHVAR